MYSVQHRMKIFFLHPEVCATINRFIANIQLDSLSLVQWLWGRKIKNSRLNFSGSPVHISSLIWVMLLYCDFPKMLRKIKWNKEAYFQKNTKPELFFKLQSPWLSHWLLSPHNGTQGIQSLVPGHIHLHIDIHQVREMDYALNT